MLGGENLVQRRPKDRPLLRGPNIKTLLKKLLQKLLKIPLKKKLLLAQSGQHRSRTVWWPAFQRNDLGRTRKTFPRTNKFRNITREELTRLDPTSMCPAGCMQTDNSKSLSLDLPGGDVPIAFGLECLFCWSGPNFIEQKVAKLNKNMFIRIRLPVKVLCHMYNLRLVSCLSSLSRKLLGVILCV